ncbi:RNA polymerase principal sigma factor HrdB [Pirellula sp. SH-Sr6A]|uniref:sigma-70 family RNA polymerase sigma factor n=1 Tax=Pirellula sp. SH-Sr6A TaxID=1632865 RepID=UPI00078D35F3|nr:sigma-70 family RNA polymerase sigma factor [Pirellula sp. SH-Sr6A]AMV31243.1 RNA polymerase principal sigma factor HrdB [Pirellula sp. SH-Sr6A]
MNSDYRIAQLRELRDQQIKFAPRGKRIEQADRAEQLLTELDPQREYPFDFLFYRVTEVRPDSTGYRLIKGNDALHDLRLFVEDITDSMNLRVEEASEPVHTVEDLSKMFNVSTKTISRWRDQGLVSRRFLADGRKRVGFLHSSVERFVSQNKTRVKRGERFSQLTDAERDDIIDRARRIAATGANLSEVARTVGREVNRSTETIRYTIKKFDQQFPTMAVFPEQREVLSEEDKRAIYQQHHRGVSTVILAKRYRRTRGSIVRILNEQRAAKIMELPLDYIANPVFEEASMVDEMVADLPAALETPRKVKAPSGLPAYLASLYEVPLLTREQEYHLFRKMNYLKHAASKLRESLDVKSPAVAVMEQIEALYEKSVDVKNKIVQSNLRLVVSIAKRHLAPHDDFFGLISDGNMSLIRAAEKFDYSRGNKFSTYASWAIMKNFARTIPDEFKHQDRFRTSSEEVFDFQQDQRADNFALEIDQAVRTDQIQKILHTLDQREQQIIVRRFGLDHRFEPLTLKEVGEAMGVTKERVRQLEARALTKLRQAASQAKIDAPE